MTNFTQLSNEASNNFIQSIIFIDDKAYKSNDITDQHDFNAKDITKAFAENGKVCAVYEPTSAQDIPHLVSVAKKSDVAVIDWQIVIEEDQTDDDMDDEADASVDDVRGLYTKQIITELLSDESSKNSLKLIIIYTGETDLEDIASDIHTDLTDAQLTDFNINEDDRCTIESSSCKIMVIAKSNREDDVGQHAELLRTKRVTYDELPCFITQQFSLLTNGLLANFAMASLTEVRRNFNHILGLFSKKLDSAYLAHQTLLPNTDDANELLVELIGSTFMSTLRYKGLNQYIDENMIRAWLIDNIEERPFNFKKNNGDNEDITFNLTHDILMKLLGSYENVENKYLSAVKETGNETHTKKRIELLASKFAITMFTDEPEYNKINQDFANLCQHRNVIIGDDYIPVLTLGTIVKSTSDESYYICIQQRCDSVRLYDNQSRRFLFLSLRKVNEGQFDFLTPAREKLKVQKGTFSLRTVKFDGSATGNVQSELVEGKRIFYPTHYSNDIPETFEFIVELKEMYAQKIIEEYSGNLSRVGLDEPEWVRRCN